MIETRKINQFDTNSIKEKVEIRPFADKPTQNFFLEWCGMNDQIKPEFISRDDWNSKISNGDEILVHKIFLDTKVIYIPEDIQLWEMKNIIEVIDQNTFPDNKEQQTQGLERITQLGKTFQQAGIYINQHLDHLNDSPEGRKIAETLAQEFYNYGLSLQTSEKVVNQEIPNTELSTEELNELDEWFLGTNAYQRQLKKIGNDKSIEGGAREKWLKNRRIKLIQIYFKALSRKVHYQPTQENIDSKEKSIDQSKKPWEKGYLKDIPDKEQKPWERTIGPIARLQESSRNHIERALDNPQRELQNSIFRRGEEQLIDKMLTPFKHSEEENERLYDTIGVIQLKKNLDQARKRNAEDLSIIELTTVNKIQSHIIKYPYLSDENNPSEMTNSQALNCLGSAVLAGRILRELGIKYASVGYLGHSLLFIRTSDGQIHWRDFTPPAGFWDNHEINNDEIKSANMSVKDVSEFIDKPNSEGIDLLIQKSDGTTTKITVNDPESHLQSSILTNQGNIFFLNHEYEEAIEMYNKAVIMDLNHPAAYVGLASAYLNIDPKREDLALIAAQKALELLPNEFQFIRFIGIIFFTMGRTEEAVLTFQKAISINPENPDMYELLSKSLVIIGDQTGAELSKSKAEQLNG